MPPAFKRCVKKVAAKKGKDSAYAICTAANAGNIKKVRQQEFKKRHSK
jgi:hypothetical protein